MIFTTQLLAAPTVHSLVCMQHSSISEPAIDMLIDLQSTMHTRNTGSLRQDLHFSAFIANSTHPPAIDMLIDFQRILHCMFTTCLHLVVSLILWLYEHISFRYRCSFPDLLHLLCCFPYAIGDLECAHETGCPGQGPPNSPYLLLCHPPPSAPSVPVPYSSALHPSYAWLLHEWLQHYRYSAC